MNIFKKLIFTLKFKNAGDYKNVIWRLENLEKFLVLFHGTNK